jgi:hypothetical protein
MPPRHARAPRLRRMRFYRRSGRPVPKSIADAVNVRQLHAQLQGRMRRVKVAAAVTLAAVACAGAGVALLVRHFVR